MTEWELLKPVGVYAPFDSPTRGRLERFVARVDQLAEMRFFKSSETLHVMGPQDGVRSDGSDTFDYESLMATVPLFRMLYSPTEPTSFSATMKLLRGAVRPEAADGPVVRDQLRKLSKGFESARRTASLGMTVEWVSLDREPLGSETMDPVHHLDLWLHGFFLHAENAKAAELEAWPIKDVSLWELCTAIRRLTGVFRVGREAVAMALEHSPSQVAA